MKLGQFMSYYKIKKLSFIKKLFKERGLETKFSTFCLYKESYTTPIGK